MSSGLVGHIGPYADPLPTHKGSKTVNKSHLRDLLDKKGWDSVVEDKWSILLKWLF